MNEVDEDTGSCPEEPLHRVTLGSSLSCCCCTFAMKEDFHNCLGEWQDTVNMFEVRESHVNVSFTVTIFYLNTFYILITSSTVQRQSTESSSDGALAQVSPVHPRVSIKHLPTAATFLKWI